MQQQACPDVWEVDGQELWRCTRGTLCASWQRGCAVLHPSLCPPPHPPWRRPHLKRGRPVLAVCPEAAGFAPTSRVAVRLSPQTPSRTCAGPTWKLARLAQWDERTTQLQCQRCSKDEATSLKPWRWPRRTVSMRAGTDAMEAAHGQAACLGPTHPRPHQSFCCETPQQTGQWCT